MSYSIVWVKRMQTDLSRSGVISDLYKSQLVQMALAAYEEGRDDGLREAKGENVDKRIARKRKDLDEIR